MALRIMSLPLGRALAYSGGEKLAMAVKAKKWEQQTVKMVSFGTFTIVCDKIKQFS
jgi:hypothetical protein